MDSNSYLIYRLIDVIKEFPSKNILIGSSPLGRGSILAVEVKKLLSKGLFLVEMRVFNIINFDIDMQLVHSNKQEP
jgi:hypothetical protein